MRASQAKSEGLRVPTDFHALSMHAAYFLTGMGVLMLGPLLPRLSQTLSISDSRGGMLFTAQFAGSFMGATLLQNDLGKSLTFGMSCIVFGYTGLAIAASTLHGFPLAIGSLLVGGFRHRPGYQCSRHHGWQTIRCAAWPQ